MMRNYNYHSELIATKDRIGRKMFKVNGIKKESQIYISDYTMQSELKAVMFGRVNGLNFMQM